jgi:hypothetical protein
MSTTRFEAHLELGEGRLSINAGASPSAALKQLGFWSAVLATVCSTGYGLAVIVMIIASASTTTTPGWQGVEAYLGVFQPIVMLPLIPSLLLAPTFVVLMACVHAYASNAKKLWSQVGLAFAIIYATMACINYIVQLTVVRLSILNRETDGLAMFVSGNPHSVFWALASAYVFMNLAMLFAAPVFAGGKLERWIRWLFLANGASAVITIFGIVVDSPMIYLLGSLVPWCVIFSAATVLLAVLFKRIGRINENAMR